jgi:hypothetical protein
VSCAAAFSSFAGVGFGHVAGGRPSAHCRRVLHRRDGAWLIHDRGVRAGARGGVLRWQLAPGLTAAALTAETVVIRNESGAAVATVIMRGAAAVGVVTRDVSLRLGQRVAAQCLELPLDASLEALTIIAPAAPAAPDGSLPTFEMEGSTGRGGVAWSDAAGRHRVIAGAPQEALPLPQGVASNADLLWWVEGRTDDGHDALLAAMPAFAPEVPDDAQRVTNPPQESGKMLLWAHISGRWAQLSVEQPRRG